MSTTASLKMFNKMCLWKEHELPDLRHAAENFWSHVGGGENARRATLPTNW